MSTILIDCDDVLADFETPALQIVRKLGGPKTRSRWDIGSALSDERDEHGCSPRASFMAEVGQYGWCSALKPIAGTAAVVEELRGIGNVVCVTTPLESSPTWAYERLKWLKTHFDFDRKHVVLTHDKMLVHGHALADDGVHNLKGREGAFLVARSYNASEEGFVRGSFEEFIEYAARRIREYQLKASLD